MIKRGRSDLAAHFGSGKSPNLNEDGPITASGRASLTNISSSNVSELLDGVEIVDGSVDDKAGLNDESKNIFQESIKDVEEDTEDPETLVKSPVELAKEELLSENTFPLIEVEIHDVDALVPVEQEPTSSQPVDEDVIINGIVEEVTGLPSTPVGDRSTSRVPCSQSAYPSRVSRRRPSSEQDSASSATGDESSTSTQQTVESAGKGLNPLTLARRRPSAGLPLRTLK